MTEDQAREVLLVMSREGAAASPHWDAADRAWATEQALAVAGEGAAPDHFVSARAAQALQRLLPRDAAAARWLQRRWWHGAWVLAALLLGGVAGLAVDQLGPPQRVNLLAPAVWAVVLWNLLVYALLAWPGRGPNLAERLAGWLLKRGDESLDLLWARHALPLTSQRLLLLMHAAAAALALGLVAGLYLRGLVLDYRAGWQSTFLDAGAVQALLAVLLAPAAALTGIGVPDVAPLRLAPGASASASAAPWIHLFAATLGLAVVLPRSVLAALAFRRARGIAMRFPLSLEGRYFESLHPLMRGGPPQPLRLLWLPQAGAAPPRLLGRTLDDTAGEQLLFDTPRGDRLAVAPVPPLLRGAQPLPVRPWWRRWAPLPPEQQALHGLQGRFAALLLPAAAESPRPPWLATLALPLIDGHAAVLGHHALWQALAAALPDDPRVERLQAAWAGHQQQRLETAAALIAASLTRIATQREPLPEPGLLGGRADDGPARERLAQRLADELQALGPQLDAALGDGGTATLAAAPGVAQVKPRVAEGRAAIVGGMVGGAVTGLKADIASGGLTMGLGALAGGVVGALGTLVAARGLNKARGTEQGHATWGEAELDALAATLLQQVLVRLGGAETVLLSQGADREALAAAFHERGATLERRLWPLLVRLGSPALGGALSATYTRAS